MHPSIQSAGSLITSAATQLMTLARPAPLVVTDVAMQVNLGFSCERIALTIHAGSKRSTGRKTCPTVLDSGRVNLQPHPQRDAHRHRTFSRPQFLRPAASLGGPRHGLLDLTSSARLVGRILRHDLEALARRSWAQHAAGPRRTTDSARAPATNPARSSPCPQSISFRTGGRAGSLVHATDATASFPPENER